MENIFYLKKGHFNEALKEQYFILKPTKDLEEYKIGEGDGACVLRVKVPSEIDLVNGNCLVRWAFFESSSSYEYKLLMHGEGFSDCLREPRHTWFENKGYIFYVNPKPIFECFKILQKYFDYEEKL